jgi:hypothetical protein
MELFHPISRVINIRLHDALRPEGQTSRAQINHETEPNWWLKNLYKNHRILILFFIVGFILEEEGGRSRYVFFFIFWSSFKNSNSL